MVRMWVRILAMLVAAFVSLSNAFERDNIVTINRAWNWSASFR